MIQGIVLAGGSGTRFWPLSRKSKPKQLLSILSDVTLLEETIGRLAPVVDNVSVSTGKALQREIKKIIPNNLIVEPCMMDTAAAIGLCATQFDEEDVLVFVPSDHHISPAKKFHQTIERAIKKAKDSIVVIGIKPTFASIAYGYIQPGEKSKVKSFREKPKKATASRYVKNGYLWNAGMFIVKAGVLLNEFKKYAPDIHEKLMEIKKGKSIKNVYEQIRKTSFDYAIMEKTDNVKYVKATFDWSDIGSFDALAALKGGKNTVMDGNIIELDSSENIVHSKKTVALIDCNNLAIIETKDALLVCPKSSVQKIKKVVQQLDDSLR